MRRRFVGAEPVPRRQIRGEEREIPERELRGQRQRPSYSAAITALRTGVASV